MDFTTLPNENDYRFIAVLNKKVDMGKLMNALGHMTAGLTSKYSSEIDMCFLQYKDKDGGDHPSISHFPFIVLKADNSNKIRVTREQAISRKIPYTDFTSTMTVGTSESQFNTTANTSEVDLEYYGICMFGRTDELREFTGKFSLFN